MHGPIEQTYTNTNNGHGAASAGRAAGGIAERGMCPVARTRSPAPHRCKRRNRSQCCVPVPRCSVLCRTMTRARRRPRSRPRCERSPRAAPTFPHARLCLSDTHPPFLRDRPLQTSSFKPVVEPVATVTKPTPEPVIPAAATTTSKGSKSKGEARGSLGASSGSSSGGSTRPGSQGQPHGLTLALILALILPLILALILALILPLILALPGFVSGTQALPSSRSARRRRACRCTC